MSLRKEKIAHIKSYFLVLQESGEEFSLNLETADQAKGIWEKHPDLKRVLDFEILSRKPGVVPPSIKLMKAMELVDYEPASDSGHFRFYPKGQLILKLLEDWAEEIALRRFGAMEIETPIIYDWSHPAIRSQGESFHERHYTVRVPNDDKEFVLRFAGDFGLFCMVSDAKISHKHLPLRIYEFSKSFRYEQSGELVGLRRLRGFSMPDIHSFCANIEQGWEEYKELYRNYANLANSMEVEYGVIFRVVKTFYEAYKEQIVEMLKYSQRPAVIEILSGMKHYWAVKHEFHGLDSVGGTCQVATVQLDVEDAEKYGIVFINEQGEKQGCVICHSSIGALERWLYLILEKAHKADIPQFPLWLSPTQVRVIPVSHKFNNFAIDLVQKLRRSSIRAEVDDRAETVGNRVRMAEMSWCPYILVVGQKEIDSGNLSVKRRGGTKEAENMRVEQLIDELKQLTNNMPFRQSSLPPLLSKHPIFFG